MFVFNYTDHRRFFQYKTYLYIGPLPNFDSRQTERPKHKWTNGTEIVFDKADYRM